MHNDQLVSLQFEASAEHFHRGLSMPKATYRMLHLEGAAGAGALNNLLAFLIQLDRQSRTESQSYLA